MKKALSVLLFAVMAFLFLSGCSAGKNADLYETGLEVAKVMEEMVDSESYANIIGVPAMIEEKLSDVSEIEFSEPVAVYELILPDADELVVKSGLADISDWSKLSPDLKDQLKNRVGFATVANLINSSQGSDTLAFCSLYTAVSKDESILCKEPVTYLYVYDINTGIAVTFSDGRAQGQFLFAEELYSTSGIDEILVPFGIGYKNIK